MDNLEDRLDPQILASLQATQTEYSQEGIPKLNPAILREDRTIPGPQNAPDVLVRIYQLGEQCDKGAHAPAVLWIHGGGFGGRDLDNPIFHKILENVVLETGAIVFAVEYRLAPEHPFPAAINDCYAALKWVYSVSVEYHIDRDRLLIFGPSAGGCLATATALMARDKDGPRLCFQILLVPTTDDRLITVSSQAITDPRIFNSKDVQECWDNYLGEIDGEVSLYAAPARATDLSGLPPAYIAIADQDPLRDEGIAYAKRLMQAGIPTELHVFPGTHHVSVVSAPDADVTKQTHAELMMVFKRVLRSE